MKLLLFDAEEGFAQVFNFAVFTDTSKSQDVIATAELIGRYDESKTRGRSIGFGTSGP